MTDCYLLSSVKEQILKAARKGLCSYETNEKVEYQTWQNTCDREVVCAAEFCEEPVEIKIKNVTRRVTLRIVYHCAISKGTVYVRLLGSVFTALVENKIIKPEKLVKSIEAEKDLPST
jgi:hypothetical protein